MMDIYNKKINKNDCIAYSHILEYFIQKNIVYKAELLF